MTKSWKFRVLAFGFRLSLENASVTHEWVSIILVTFFFITSTLERTLSEGPCVRPCNSLLQDGMGKLLLLEVLLPESSSVHTPVQSLSDIYFCASEPVIPGSAHMCVNMWSSSTLSSHRNTEVSSLALSSVGMSESTREDWWQVLEPSSLLLFINTRGLQAFRVLVHWLWDWFSQETFLHRNLSWKYKQIKV